MRRVLMVLAISGLCAGLANAGAKTYHVNVPEKVVVGSAELKPGSYRMRLEDKTAVFLDENAKQAAKAEVEVTTESRKFDRTEVRISREAGNSERMVGIDLGGTKLKLVFPN
ncbi:hypothetical protein [Paludibaculum fermentans]|uniref:Uncharacterized protein n=1 Tax=Paludibaculum fermentans TaxID=1473598 RepID=A0A7S7SLI3_PALFE|nr:hypothetical protein [Paludibaculum fermentans]QOY88883.1 hypothetical protein IRI77_02670 [Paludibaculum fermentans]